MKDRANIFEDDQGQPRVLIGAAVVSGSLRLAEFAGRIGFDTVFIDMEHASTELRLAEQMCMAVETGGALPLVRITGTRREHVLQALEIGGRIILAPLVNDAATAQEIVRHGKYRPLGERGFNTRSRGLGYGIDPQAMQKANQATALMVQIETLEAVKNLDAILAVEGLDGVFIGPGDLSADLGRTGKFDDPELIEMTVSVMKRARARGRHAGILTGEGPLLDAARAAGADLCIVGFDLRALHEVWQPQLQRLRQAKG